MEYRKLLFVRYATAFNSCGNNKSHARRDANCVTLTQFYDVTWISTSN